VKIIPWHGSADLAALARANGLARLPAEKKEFGPGTLLQVMLL
jgi:molybdopterin biosynthesis enzyme